ncbi:hypothetical protein JW933_10985, partial [candidate division FCPU426 bacterium]|nr:hypothetical protein [candidate division FCPU426 bacterium]
MPSPPPPWPHQIKDRQFRQHTPIRLFLQPAAAQRVARGYPWVFSNQITTWEAMVGPGELVEVCDRRGRSLGYGYANPDVFLCIRLLYTTAAGRRGGGVPDETAELMRKLNRARSRRLNLHLDSDAYRLVWSEADGLPGLVCDVYRDVVVLQALTAGMERRKPRVLDWLLRSCRPRGVYERSDG